MHLRLVINADGFGRSPEISRGIVRAHREGVVTSTSVLGHAPDLPALVAELAEVPKLGVGLELSLTDGLPVAPAAQVQSLLTPDARFLDEPRAVGARWFAGDLRADEVERELAAQVERARAAGLAPDHLHVHGNLGLLPLVGLALERVAKRFAIPGLRTTTDGPSIDWFVDPRRGLQAAARQGMSWLLRRKLGALRHGPQSWCLGPRPPLDDITLLETLGRLPAGDHEIVCFPTEVDEVGPPDRRRAVHTRAELDLLVSPSARRAIDKRGATLCRWRDLF